MLQAKIRAGLEEREQEAGHEPLVELPSSGLKPLDIVTRLQRKVQHRGSLSAASWCTSPAATTGYCSPDLAH